jgi:pimeloyl-ACP methyl ester carboxylesterase
MRSAAADARTRPPVLVVSGVGLTAGVAARLTTALEAHFEVLAVPLGYGSARDGDAGDESTPASAEQALALVDGLGVEQVHVVGLSFGGVIAQEIAIRHPGRVRSLVLASSTAGGARYVAPDPAIAAFLLRLDELPPEEGLWASVPYLYAANTRRLHAPLIGEDIARRMSRELDTRAYRRQYAIARAHDAGARVSEITAPTLVMHGEQDRILPLENGLRLADGIARARLVPLAGGAHAFPTDVPEAARELVNFLVANSKRRAGSGARRSGRAARA